MSGRLNLDLDHPMIHQQAIKAIDDRDVTGLLCLASGGDCLAVVHGNALILQERGLYEEALLDAYSDGHSKR
jgi:hypothetical protein